ncbi:Hypothetical protein A7982_11436 [Minicystis rosea]|nr:Hypothetical protein A7982_11436 [Minicystis rosea]
MVFSGDGGVYLRLVTDITLYWRGSMFDHAQGIQSFYAKALRLIGSHLKFYRTESMEGSRPLKADSLQLLPDWFRKRRGKGKGIYMLSLEGGNDKDEPSEHGFYLLADQEEETRVGAVRLILPSRFMDTGYESVANLLAEVVEGFDFDSGHAGFAVNWDPEGEYENEAASQMLMLAKKYPGIDLNCMDSTIIALQHSGAPAIKCVNWLTLMGKGLQQRLPALEEVRKELGSVCPVHELPGCWVIQAGPSPALGYPDKDEMTPYRRAGSLLASLRLQRHPAIFAESDPGYGTGEWLARFDGHAGSAM